MNDYFLAVIRSQRGTDEKSTLFFISSIIGLCLTLFGSLALLLTYIKIKQSNPLASLVLYTALFDSLFSTGLFIFYDFSIGTFLEYLIEFIMYISAHCSLACTCIISFMYYFNSRAAQQRFLSNFKRWVIISVIFFTGFDTLILAFTILYKDLDILFFGFWTFALILVGFISYSNMRLLYVLKTMSLTLVDKTPVYLSLVGLVIWLIMLVGNFLMFVLDSKDNFLNILCNFLVFILGFMNYLIGNSRLKKMVIKANEEYAEMVDSTEYSNSFSINEYLINAGNFEKNPEL